MNECFKCGISGEKALLFETITFEGIQKVCRKCSFDIDTPIIKKKTDIPDYEKEKSVYERLSRIAGLNATEHRKRIYSNELYKSENAQDKELRKIVEEKYRSKFKKTSNENLIKNFHWVITQSRRMKKISREKMAKDLNIPKSVIAFAEQGIIPNDKNLILKIENYLNIKISKETFQKELPKELNLGDEKSKMLTIDELKKISREKEILENPQVFKKNSSNLTIQGEEYELDETAKNIDEEPEFIDIAKEEVF